MAANREPPQPFRFLDLPGEIREHIFSEILKLEPHEQEEGDGEEYKLLCSYKCNLRVLQVCRQFFDEASHIFWRQNYFVKIFMPGEWSQAQEYIHIRGCVPLIASEHMSKRFDAQVLDVEISPRDGEFEEPRSFVITLHDLDGFCRMWYYSDMSYPGLNNHLSVKLHLRNPADRIPGRRRNLKDEALPLALQQQLILPFGQVRNIYSIVITGKHEASLEADMREGMRRQYKSPEECLDECIQLKSKGNELANNNRWAEAMDLYVQSLHAMHILVKGKWRAVWADRHFEKELTSGSQEGKYGGIVRLILRIQLVANMTQAYLKLGNPEMSYFWGRRSIDVMRNTVGEAADTPRPEFPAVAEWGKVHYRTAQAAKALGKDEEYVEFLKIAAKWLPNDRTVQAEAAPYLPKLL